MSTQLDADLALIARARRVPGLTAGQARLLAQLANEVEELGEPLLPYWRVRVHRLLERLA